MIRPLLPGGRVEIRRCPVADRAEALALLYRPMPRALRAQLAEQGTEQARRGDLDLSGLWVARRGGRLLGALLSQRLAGRAALIYPPEVSAVWGRSAIAAGLVAAALGGLPGSGVRIAQALLDEHASARARADLARGGLPMVTHLAYLGRATAAGAAGAGAAAPLSWVGYSEARAEEFRAVLAATHVGSLDMPELEGARSLDDLRAAQEAAGRFDPGRWRLGRVPGEPDAAALLVLAATPEVETWEVAYLGLTPAARGRGLGRAALAHALELARPHARRLELAVDVRNAPAMRLYGAAGFEVYAQRAVHLKVWRE